MGESVSLPHDATLRTYPARQYKSKRYQAAYSCTHCSETLSGKPVAYSLSIPWSVPIPAKDASQIFFDFCSEEHARLWLDDQVAQAQARNQARALAYRESLSEIKACIDCKQEFPANERGHLVVPFFDVHSTTCERCGKPLEIEYTEDGRVNYGCPGHLGGSGTAMYGYSEKYCPTCREERRKKNRQSYPLCPMCSTPTRLWDFLREYQGYHLDLIKVCCKNCIPHFEAFPEPGQVALLRQAMVRAYGETAVIYALQYEGESFPYNHIGRTKHYKRRMAEYKRDWHREIKQHCILEELPFGPLSMERESRWMFHALKHGWPIDNFELLKIGEDGLGGTRLQAQLTEAVQSFEPLIAPFEVVWPLIHRMMNTCDSQIVHWFVEQPGISID